MPPSPDPPVTLNCERIDSKDGVLFICTVNWPKLRVVETKVKRVKG